MITAKPVLKNRYWILKENDQKVGSVESTENGFVVRLKNDAAEFNTIRTIKNRTNIIFEEPESTTEHSGYSVHGFATDVEPHNPVYNVKDRLPIFTREEKSKSWYAAGYYQITINGKTDIHFCPKLILLQRYDYRGPAHSADGFEFK